MYIKIKRSAYAIAIFSLLAFLSAMAGMSSAAGPTWSQTGAGTGAAYRISLSPAFKTDRTAFWVWGDSNICRTRDGFSTWTTVYTTGDPYKRMQSVGVSPSFPSDGTAFGGSTEEGAAGNGSVVKSTDGGLSWAPAALGSYSLIHAESVAFSPGFSNSGSGRVFIGTNKGGLSSNNGLGVVYSDNGGSSWNGSTGLPNYAGVVSVAVSPGYGTDHTLFAAVDADNTTGSIYRSIDSGAGWSKLSMVKVHAALPFNAVDVAVSPDYSKDHSVFAVSQAQGLYRSTDYGDSWTSMAGKPGLPDLPMSSVDLSPNYSNDHTLFVATDSQSPDRIFMSTDQGENWQEITTGNEGFGVYSIAVSPDYQHDRTLYVGTKSNGIWAYTGVIPTPSSTVTDPVDGALMSHGSVSYSITGTASCTDGIKSVEVSTDGGTTWHTASGTTSWSYSWANPGPGTYNILSKATSDSDIAETPSSGITVRVDRYSLAASTVPADGSFGMVTKSAPSVPPYYGYNEVATLTAFPVAGYALKAWGGDASGSGSPMAVAMTSDKSVTATFAQTYSLSVNTNNNLYGSVGILPASGPYFSDTPVSLTAAANPGYRFTGWTGDTAGIANTSNTSVSFAMGAGNRSLTANFDLAPVDGLNLSMAQNGTGVTYNVGYTVGGVPQAGKSINLYSKLHTSTSWTLKATVSTSTAGTISKAVTLSNGTYDLKATYSTTTSNIVACVVAAVSVPAQGVTNPSVTPTPTPTLTWNAFAGATGYVIQTCAGSTFTAGTYLESPNVGNVTSAVLPSSMALARGVKKYWRIVALIPTGRSVPSAARYITYKENTSFTGLSANAKGNNIQPSVTLVGADGGIPSGKTVTFYYKRDSVSTWSTATAKTDTTGMAKLSLPKTLTTSGAYHLYAKFAGDSSYAAATSAQVPFTIPTALTASGRYREQEHARDRLRHPHGSFLGQASSDPDEL